MLHRKHYFKLFYLVLSTVFLFSFIYPAEIRVAVVKDGKNISISLPRRFSLKIYPSIQKIYNSIRATRKINIKKKVGGYEVNHIRIYTSRIKKIALTNLNKKHSRMTVNGRQYRGDITVIFASRVIVVNKLPLEQYVYGVLPAEISPTWPMEAIKAQAVAARTYAVFIINSRRTADNYFDLDATTNFQVYKGSFYEAARTNKAVDFTKNEIMLYHHQPIEAYFHSISGGYTESAENVWGKYIPYLRSVRDDYSRIAPDFYWKYRVKTTKLQKLLGLGAIKKIKLKKGKRNFRVRKVTIISDNGVFKFKPSKFRQLFGEYKIRSTAFNISRKNGYVIFRGQGFGHGVGLSQWGAYGMALKGRQYEDILRYYYHDIRFKRIHENRTF